MKRVSLPRGICLLSLALLLTSCAQYATVSEARPKFRPIRTGATVLLSAEQSIERALLQENRRPAAAIGELLYAADIASRELAKNPSDSAARANYNYAVARVFSIIKKTGVDPWRKPLSAAAETGEYQLTYKPDPRPQWNPALYEFTPVDDIFASGLYVNEKIGKEGLGAPLVAVGRDTYKDSKKEYTPQRLFYGVTALVRFSGRVARIEFLDPLATEEVRLNRHTFTLAADFTMPLAVMLARTNPKQFELTRLLRPEKYAETARIARLQPFDPNKTVVLVVHGLMDSPATWAPMINTLRADKTIRENYQFWFYSYPSGYPYPYSASILRKELDEVAARYPMRKKMVLIGHSMGGCISRLLITDSGDQLWMDLFGKPPGETKLSPETEKIMKGALIFRNRPEVGRVIFIAAPLRGSDLASNWAGRIGSMLVKSPSTLVAAGGDMLKVTTFRGDDLKLKRVPNSVDTLAPNNRFVKAINRIPITSGVPYHTIIGDRGRGDSPNSSDGIVPYWSSHLGDAQSECIVPSGHTAHQNPKAIAEVRRILTNTVTQRKN